MAAAAAGSGADDGWPTAGRSPPGLMPLLNATVRDRDAPAFPGQP